MKKTILERAIRLKCESPEARLIPECRLEYPDGSICRSDFLYVTPSGYITEFEIKVNRQDWENDKTKTKWTAGFPDFISKFIYVVPAGLETPPWIVDWAGIWHVTPNKHLPHVEVFKKPRIISSKKATGQLLELWLSKFYQLYWNEKDAAHIAELSHASH